MAPKPKNPLYVVTNKGKDVESAKNLFDVLVKKFNLEPVIELLKTFLKMFAENAKSYATFVEMKKLFDQYVGPLLIMLNGFMGKTA